MRDNKEDETKEKSDSLKKEGKQRFAAVCISLVVGVLIALKLTYVINEFSHSPEGVLKPTVKNYNAQTGVQTFITDDDYNKKVTAKYDSQTKTVKDCLTRFMRKDTLPDSYDAFRNWYTVMLKSATRKDFEIQKVEYKSDRMSKVYIVDSSTLRKACFNLSYNDCTEKIIKDNLVKQEEVPLNYECSKLYNDLSGDSSDVFCWQVFSMQGDKITRGTEFGKYKRVAVIQLNDKVVIPEKFGYPYLPNKMSKNMAFVFYDEVK